MFSATKFVVAGALLALFGGFLLSGVLTQQPSDDRPQPSAHQHRRPPRPSRPLPRRVSRRQTSRPQPPPPTSCPVWTSSPKRSSRGCSGC
jgi:hypothetical protein